jgi:hypothetical protein
MNFYLNAVDEQLRLGDDRESVGIILCTDRDETVAKLALHRVYAPIAVSTWKAGYAAGRSYPRSRSPTRCLRTSATSPSSTRSEPA